MQNFTFFELNEQAKNTAIENYQLFYSEYDGHIPFPEMDTWTVERNHLKYFDFLDRWFNQEGIILS